MVERTSGRRRSASTGGDDGTYGSGRASSATRASSRATASSYLAPGSPASPDSAASPMRKTFSISDRRWRKWSNAVTCPVTDSTASGSPAVVVGDVGQALDLADHVVAEVADDAAVERGQVVDLRGAVLREQRLERDERALVGGDAVGHGAVELHRAPPHDQRSAGSRPRKVNRPHRCAVLHRLEQEPRCVTGARTHELHEGRDRRLEVGQHLGPHRHDGVLPGQREELGPRRPDHVGPIMRSSRPGRGAQTRPGVAPVPKPRKKQDRSPVWQAPRPSCSTTKSSASPSQS